MTPTTRTEAPESGDQKRSKQLQPLKNGICSSLLQHMIKNMSHKDQNIISKTLLLDSYQLKVVLKNCSPPIIGKVAWLRFVDQLVILTEVHLVKKSQPLPSSVYFSNWATWCNLASSSLSNLPSLPLVRVELDVMCSVVPPSSTHELPSTSTSTAPHTSTTFYSPFFMFPTVVSCLQNWCRCPCEIHNQTSNNRTQYASLLQCEEVAQRRKVNTWSLLSTKSCFQAFPVSPIFESEVGRRSRHL